MGNEVTPNRRPATRAAAATERRLAEQRDAVEREVSRILAVTLRLIEASAPAMPSISEIVAAAGISTQTLYRYFGSKDSLILAVLEQGVIRLAEWLEARMARVDEPLAQVAAWVDGILRQVEHTEAAAVSRVVLGNLDKSAELRGYSGSMLGPVVELLDAPLAAVDRAPHIYGPLVADLVFGTLRRHLWGETVPGPDELQALRDFVTDGIVR
jgi:AcrR family transcriptional regulator